MNEREIKWRVWDGEKFHYSSKQSTSAFTDYHCADGFWGQEFTGMVNALGQLIYEGDVVEVLGKSWEVKFDHCAFIIVAIDGSEKLPHYLGGYADCVVVGNIFEGVSQEKRSSDEDEKINL